jgi:hypothetical protein
VRDVHPFLFTLRNNKSKDACVSRVHVRVCVDACGPRSGARKPIILGEICIARNAK